MNHFQKYLKYKKKYLTAAAAIENTIGETKTVDEETDLITATQNNKLSIYSNLGGVNGQTDLITEKEYNQIELSLDIVISKIDQFNPNFLHIIFGGNCSRGFNMVQQLNCKKEEFFGLMKIIILKLILT